MQLKIKKNVTPLKIIILFYSSYDFFKCIHEPFGVLDKKEPTKSRL
jgi:hypothetical protein